MTTDTLATARQRLKKRKAKAKGKSCSCGCGDAKACDTKARMPSAPKAPTAPKSPSGQSAGIAKDARTGKLKSKRAKVGGECSQAMSDWKRTGMTPAVAAVLGKCRARARMLSQGKNARLGGNEARAQTLEKRADRGLTMKERSARAKDLVAARRGKAESKPAGVAKPSLRQQADAARQAKGSPQQRLEKLRRQELHVAAVAQHRIKQASKLKRDHYSDATELRRESRKDPAAKPMAIESMRAARDAAREKRQAWHRGQVTGHRISQLEKKLSAAPPKPTPKPAPKFVRAPGQAGTMGGKVKVDQRAKVAKKPALRPASEVPAEGRQFASERISGVVSAVQRSRWAKYRATVEAGRGAGMVNRDWLKKEREALGITAERLKAARRTQQDVIAEAEKRGFDGRQLVVQTKREIVDRRVSNIGKNGMSDLYHGKGYFRSATQKRQFQAAKDSAESQRYKEVARRAEEQRIALGIQADPKQIAAKEQRARVQRAIQSNQDDLERAAYYSAANLKNSKQRRAEAAKIRASRVGNIFGATNASTGERARRGRPMLPSDLRKGDEIVSGIVQRDTMGRVSSVYVSGGDFLRSNAGTKDQRKGVVGNMIARGKTMYPVRDNPALERIRQRRAARASS